MRRLARRPARPGTNSWPNPTRSPQSAPVTGPSSVKDDGHWYRLHSDLVNSLTCHLLIPCGWNSSGTWVDLSVRRLQEMRTPGAEPERAGWENARHSCRRGQCRTISPTTMQHTRTTAIMRPMTQPKVADSGKGAITVS